MTAFIKRLCSTKLFPGIWTFLIIILLCLPGSAIPGSGIFALPQLDKFVHVILFGGMVLFWGSYIHQIYYDKQWIKKVIVVTLVTIALGIALEYVQFYFIPNRSFDVKDILADTGGALLAFYLTWRWS